MSDTERIRHSAVPYLDDGELVQAAFGGQSLSLWVTVVPIAVAVGVCTALNTNVIVMFLVGAALTVPVSLATKYRNVIVTDRRILVLARSPWVGSKATSIVRELPRATLIGPAPLL